jgi:cation diffusion facilitator family transporter
MAASHERASLTASSRRVIYAALVGNVAITIAKLVAFVLSGSSAMLTEAVHSFVDSADQLLLLLGEARSRKRRDRSHPLGYGMETYFWSFIVAVMVMLAGGVASVYQGVHRLASPSSVTSPALSFIVLGLAAAFEGSSFAIGFREFKRVVRGRDITLWTFIKTSKDPSLFATLLEDFAALVGIGLAALSLIASTVFRQAWADGAGSIAIGMLLVTVAVVMANEIRSLIAGEAVAPRVHGALKRTLAADDRISQVHEIATLHLGPRVVMVALTLSFASEMKLSELRRSIHEITEALQAVDDRIEYVFVRPAER